tara:strand:+ start:304 stop:816 length:513 start_codon:yes stop_codon:yes gene_type:complete
MGMRNWVVGVVIVVALADPSQAVSDSKAPSIYSVQPSDFVLMFENCQMSVTTLGSDEVKSMPATPILHVCREEVRGKRIACKGYSNTDTLDDLEEFTLFRESKKALPKGARGGTYKNEIAHFTVGVLSTGTGFAHGIWRIGGSGSGVVGARVCSGAATTGKLFLEQLNSK